MSTIVVRSKEVLQRSPLVEDKQSEKVEQLAVRAKLILGYEALADKVIRPVKLARVLQDLKIQPFLESTVETYKQKKLTEVRQELSERKKKVVSFRRQQMRATWKRILIQDYTRVVPEFALRKGIQIMEACPDVRVEVEALVLQKVASLPKPRHTPDPFLLVSLGAERFYVEVWDERKFERRLC